MYLDQWKKALESGAEVHCLGDFNIDSQRLHDPNIHQKPLVNALLQQVVPLGVTQCAPAATWTPQGGQHGQPSGLDHHWTNRPEKLLQVQAVTIGHSDHKLISSVRYAKLVQVGQQFVKKRSYKTFSESKFLEEVRKVKWWEVYKCEDVNEAVEVFTNCITAILDRPDMAPMRTFQARRHYASWLSEETKVLMATRDQAMAEFNRTGQAEDWNRARTLRNQVTRLLKTEKCRDARRKVKNCEEERDVGRVWQNIRGYLGWGGTGGAPTRLADKTGRLVTSPAAMAELQNEYYIEKVKKIRQKLPQQGSPTEALRQHIQSLPRPRPDSLALACVSPEAVDKMIMKLKNSKSCGLDNIDTYILKLARPYIVPSITHIINLSISTLVFPKAYKVAKVVPLFKGKDSPTLEPKSYRPVSLLPIVSKILERVVQNQLVDYMDRNQHWHPQHHAYKSNHSITTVCMTPGWKLQNWEKSLV